MHVCGGCVSCHAGKVEYDRVWFQYEGRNPVLRDVTFTVPGGKTVAFVVRTRHTHTRTHTHTHTHTRTHTHTHTHA